MTPTRRGLLVASAGVTAGLGGCITDPGGNCPGATVRLTLSPVDAVDEPLVLDAEVLSTAANAVVETAVESEHVERCVTWDGEPGPSTGLREVGDRLETHLDVDLSERRGTVDTDVRRDGEAYELELAFDRGGV